MQPSPEGLVPSPAFLETHLAPRVSFNSSQPSPPPELASYRTNGERVLTPSLRTPPSKFNRRILYTVHELPQLLDSSSVSAPAWSELARLLRANYEFYDGFVILHGTDSLAYTASALSFMIRNLQKPIILTGSQSPMGELYSDAERNLLDALIIAGHFRIPEVCLFFNLKLFRGNRATKVSADSYDAFASPNIDPLAERRANGVRVHWNHIRKLQTPDGTAPPPLHILSRIGTAQVACVRLFPGILPEMLDAVLKLPRLRGLIIETFGAGNAPIKTGEEDGGLLQVMREATRRENVIVGVSQCKFRFTRLITTMLTCI
jgi:60kDa lysophospholipase